VAVEQAIEREQEVTRSRFRVARAPQRTPRRLWIYLIMAVVMLIIAFPIYWMATISLKLPRDIYRVPSLWPHTVTMDNYRVLIVEKHFLTNIRNSLIVASTVTILSVFVSAFAAYSIVRFKYRFRGVVGRVILFAYLTPTSLLFIPLSIIVARLNLGNSLYGLIIVYLTFSLPLSTWLLSGYFRGVPVDLEEQAMVDGSTRLGALFRILLPLSAPGIVAVAIFTFTGAWNELLLALIFITSENKRTVPLALQYLITGDVFLWGPIMAGAVLSALPVMILYFLAQRFMVQGMTMGSVKG
jgi:multiple sugar transport system permease protein